MYVAMSMCLVKLFFSSLELWSSFGVHRKL